jgi:hypothetical protein
MSRSHESPAVREVAATRAMDDLRFIRTAMEGASGFTSVPGAWLAVVGGLALGTVACLRFVADAAPGSEGWVVAWAIAAALSLATGAWMLRRKASGVPGGRASRPGRKLVLGVGAPLAAGLLASLGAWRAGVPDLLPGLWLASYGAGVLAGGAFSPRPVLALGGCCLALGGAAFFAPLAFADALLGAGFGALHLGCGLVIARRHGG